VDLDRLRARLREDFPFYARAVLKVNDRGKLVPFLLRPAQHDLWAILAKQRREGRPMGAVILKARKLGFSTFAQGLLLQRTTLLPLHSSAVIAHNAQTAGVIMQMAELMYANWCCWSPPPTATTSSRACATRRSTARATTRCSSRAGTPTPATPAS
jgi:hypothetical protein